MRSPLTPDVMAERVGIQRRMADSVHAPARGPRPLAPSLRFGHPLKGAHPLQNPRSNPTRSSGSPHARSPILHPVAFRMMAERVGFEPTVPLPAHVLSRHADSATLAPLRIAGIIIRGCHLSMEPSEQQDTGEGRHCREVPSRINARDMAKPCMAAGEHVSSAPQ